MGTEYYNISMDIEMGMSILLGTPTKRSPYSQGGVYIHHDMGMSMKMGTHGGHFGGYPLSLDTS